jgi:hypothetical protein
LLLRWWLLCCLLCFAGVLAVPAPDGPVVGPAVLLALQVEAGDAAEDVQPVIRVAADLDLRASGSKRIEGLVEQVPHNAGLGLVAGCPNVTDRQVIVNTHVAFDEAGHIPFVCLPIVALEDQDIASSCRT